MSELTPAHKDLLLIHLVRCERVIQRAVGLLEPKLFDPSTERTMAVIWAASSEFYAAHHQMIPSMTLRAEVDRRVAGDPDWSGNPFLAQQISEVMEMVYAAADGQMMPEYGLSLLQQFLEERNIRPLIQRASYMEMPELVRAINENFAKSRLSTADSVDVFDFTRSAVEEASALRVPTGFGPFDMMLNGGPRKGDTIGLLGPTGGGKTMMAVLTSIANAYTNKERTLYLTYEQPVDPEVRERLWTAAANVDRKLIEGKKYSELNDDIRRTLEAQADSLRSLRALDFSGRDPHHGFGGINEIEAAVQQEIMAGRRPSALVIDWVGIAVQRYMAAMGVTDERERTGFIMMFCDGAKTLASRYDLWCVLCHQLSGAAGKRGPTAELTQYDAANCTLFAAQCTACITIGRMDKKSMVAKISNPKARCGGDGTAWVKIDNVKHQMTLTGHEYTYVYSGRDGEGRLAAKDSLDEMGSARLDVGALSEFAGRMTLPVNDAVPPPPESVDMAPPVKSSAFK